MNKNDKIRQVTFPKFSSQLSHYMLSIVVIGLTGLICSPLSTEQGYHVVSFILLFVVSILATFMGIGPIFLASTLASLVWNFFFIPPHYTFHIDKTEDILMFGMFFIIALLNGILTSRLRKQEKLARDREKHTNALFQLTRELSKASGMDEVLTVAIREIRNHFSVDSLFILQDGKNILASSGRLQREKKLSPVEYGTATWVFEHARKAGDFPDKTAYTFYPLHGTRIKPGVVAVKLEKPFSEDKNAFWDTFLAQVSNALEREFLGELAQKARFLDESDKLYKTLFNSISHEFRIPVATIMAASDTLMALSHSGNVQSALYNEIFTASVRLNQLIENLLNMSRLESGRLSVRLDWYDINDLVNKLSEDLNDELKPFALLVSVPDDMPLVRIDYGLMEQVLYNILINACHQAPVASNISLETGHSEGELAIRIMDRGPGFPEEALNNVFQKFFRVAGSKTGGLGLGLSIVKGFVEAHKGTVSVENRKDGGAAFTIRVPSELVGDNFGLNSIQSQSQSQ
jgi:two-component system sensor histidine kinase KdpD